MADVKPQVLHIDDEPLLSEHVEFELEDRGYGVIASESIQQAKEILSSSQKINIILCDFRLKDGTCEDLLKFLRESSSPLKVVVITGYYHELNIEPELKEWICGQLGKPTDFNELHEIIQQTLAS